MIYWWQYLYMIISVYDNICRWYIDDEKGEQHNKILYIHMHLTTQKKITTTKSLTYFSYPHSAKKMDPEKKSLNGLFSLLNVM